MRKLRENYNKARSTSPNLEEIAPKVGGYAANFACVYFDFWRRATHSLIVFLKVLARRPLFFSCDDKKQGFTAKWRRAARAAAHAACGSAASLRLSFSTLSKAAKFCHARAAAHADGGSAAARAARTWRNFEFLEIGLTSVHTQNLPRLRPGREWRAKRATPCQADPVAILEGWRELLPPRPPGYTGGRFN